MQRKSIMITAILFVFVLTGLLTIATGPADAKEMLIRLAVPAPPGDFPLTAGAEDLAKRFNERAKGAYKIEVFAGGALVKIPEYFDAIRVGAIEMAMIDWSIFSFLDPRLGLVGLPFLINNLDAGIAAAPALATLHNELLREKFNAAGLGMFSVGGVDLISNKPVVTLAQWKGLLVGAGSPMTASMFKELGASPVTIAWTDLYESLQKNVIDSTAQVVHGAVMTGLFEVAKQVNVFFGQAAYNGFMVNMKVWNDMPQDIKTILQDEINQKIVWMHDNMRRLEQEDITMLKGKGIKINVVAKAERDRWAAALAPFNAKQIESFGAFGQRIKQIADEANAKHPYVEMVVK